MTASNREEMELFMIQDALRAARLRAGTWRKYLEELEMELDLWFGDTQRGADNCIGNA